MSKKGQRSTKAKLVFPEGCSQIADAEDLVKKKWPIAADAGGAFR